MAAQVIQAKTLVLTFLDDSESRISLKGKVLELEDDVYTVFNTSKPGAYPYAVGYCGIVNIKTI